MTYGVWPVYQSVLLFRFVWMIYGKKAIPKSKNKNEFANTLNTLYFIWYLVTYWVNETVAKLETPNFVNTRRGSKHFDSEITSLRITVTSNGFEKDGVDLWSDGGWGSLSQNCKCFSSFNFVLVNFAFLLFYEYLKRVFNFSVLSPEAMQP